MSLAQYPPVFPGNLPEVSAAALTAAAAANTLLGQITRLDTTAAPITQPLPAATPGAVLAVGWEAGSNTLTLTASGADVIGPGAITSTPFTFAGELRTLHCTTAGRWRETSKVIPSASVATPAYATSRAVALAIVLGG